MIDLPHGRRARGRSSLQVILGNQALILHARGDLDGAMAKHKEVERICLQLGNLDGKASILKASGDLDGAMALYKKKEQICRQLGNVEGLVASLINQASTLRQMGRAREGLPLAQQAYQVASSHGYAALAKQIEPILDAVQQAAQGP